MAHLFLPSRTLLSCTHLVCVPALDHLQPLALPRVAGPGAVACVAHNLDGGQVGPPGVPSEIPILNVHIGSGVLCIRDGNAQDKLGFRQRVNAPAAAGTDVASIPYLALKHHRSLLSFMPAPRFGCVQRALVT